MPAAVFVLPTLTDGTLGPVAAYLSTAGWAAAADRVLGQTWIVCPTGTIDPVEARRRGTRRPARGPGGAAGPGAAPTATPAWRRAALAARRHAPTVVKTLAKDGRQLVRARRFAVDVDGPWRDADLAFVWQRHALFETAGIDLARALDRPSVLFVPATKVWEAERWGTRRPGWGRLLERVAEEPALRRADLVACGSAEVAEQAVRLGTPPDRVVVTPTGVDPELFSDAEADRDRVRTELGLDGCFVVGWVGSFQPFHALELAVDAVGQLPDAALLLVGDGPERPAVQALARRRGIRAVLTGTVPHAELPRHLAAMDAALVLAPRDEGFHYSPLKLGEYLASGLPVVAPAVGPITARLTDGVDALLVPRGDADALRDALGRLQSDPDLRRALGQKALATARHQWSWDEQVRRVVAALGGADDPARPG